MSPSKARAVATKAPRERLGIWAAIRKASRLLPLLTPPRMRSDRYTRLTRVLPRRPVEEWCPGRSPGSRIVLLPTPSRPRTTTASGANVGFVPDYSDGVAADSHRLPLARTRRAARPSVKPDVHRPADRGQPPAGIRLSARRWWRGAAG